MFAKNKADEYILNNKDKVNRQYKPKFHFSAETGWINDPNGFCRFNGQYHLFYQFNPIGPYWQQIHWGHWVSDDMVVWKNVKEAISPTADSVAPDGIWSGGAAYMADGTPALLFTAGDDSRRLNQISNQNIGIAYPEDLSDPDLTKWVMGENLIGGKKYNGCIISFGYESENHGFESRWCHWNFLFT